MPESKTERTLRARSAALARSAVTPGRDISAPARAARLQKFYDSTDPALPEAERQRQANAALQRAMTDLSRRAAQKRRKARELAGELCELADEVADAASQLAS